MGADEEARALAEATTEVGGNGEVEVETDGETGQGEAMTDTERADEAVAGADEVLIGANRSVQVLAHKPRVVARKSAVRAAGASIMVTGTRSPSRACQHGEELSLAGMHRAGSCPTGGCLETSWQARLGSAGAQMEIGTAGLHSCLQVVVAYPAQ